MESSITPGLLPGSMLRALNQVVFSARAQIINNAMASAGGRMNESEEIGRVTRQELLDSARMVFDELMPELTRALDDGSLNNVRKAS